MSAGLVLASLSRRPGVTLQITTGRRTDLVRVTNKTERPLNVAMSRIVVERQMEVLSAGWQEFGYEAAATGFEKLRLETNAAGGSKDLVGELRFRAELSGAFAAWDRFAHNDAAKRLDRLRRHLPAGLLVYSEIAQTLARDDEEGKFQAGFLRDLLLSAERCGRRGRYDDAVARLYRLWEATAQWLLFVGEKIETKRIDPRGLPDRIVAGQNPHPKTGTIELGSSRAWALWRHLQPESAATRFWTDSFEGTSNEAAFTFHSRHRNLSILAHGTEPVTLKHWNKIYHWTANSFMEMVRAEAIRFGEDCTAPQLPTDILPKG
jgi:CRISPR-associated protein (TIGR02710 family)